MIVVYFGDSLSLDALENKGVRGYRVRDREDARTHTDQGKSPLLVHAEHRAGVIARFPILADLGAEFIAAA